MMKNNTDAPMTLVDISDVSLLAVIEDDYSESEQAAFIDGFAVGPLTEYAGNNKPYTTVGWYRLSKSPYGFLFESFAGDSGDESSPLLTDTLVLKAYPVKMDSMFALMSAIEGTQEEPEVPAAVTIVTRWFYDLRNRAVLRQRYAEIFDQIENLELFSAGGACPFQAEGKIEDLFFYFRFRGDHMTLKLARVYDDIWSKPLYMSSQFFGDGSGFTGWLDKGDFVEQFIFMVRKLERAPMLWRFEGTFLEDDLRSVAGDPSHMSAWGDSPEEAWDRLWDMGEGEEQRERMKDHVTKHGLDPQTVTVDDRVFPDPEPDFKALAGDTERKDS